MNLHQAGETLSVFCLSAGQATCPKEWRAKYAPTFNKIARHLVKSFHAHKQAALVVTDAWAGLAEAVSQIELGGVASYTPVDTRGLKVRLRHQMKAGPKMLDPVTREVIPNAQEVEDRQRFERAKSFLDKWVQVWVNIRGRLREDLGPANETPPRAALPALTGEWPKDIANYFLDGAAVLPWAEVKKFGVRNTDPRHVARVVNRAWQRIRPESGQIISAKVRRDNPVCLYLKAGDKRGLKIS